MSYERRTTGGRDAESDRADSDGEESLLVVLNLTPVPRAGYRIGAPVAGVYRQALCSDDRRYGGSGFAVAEEVETERVEADDCRQSLVLDLPPLAALVLAPEGRRRGRKSPSVPKTIDTDGAHRPQSEPDN